MSGQRYSPVIVIGMHRSGTSMLVGMLRDLGLFIGAKSDLNNEPRLILALERRLLRHAGGTWQSPEAIDGLLQSLTARRLAVDHLRQALAHPRVVSYLGWSRYLRYHTPANLDHPWGWKTPCTTYTLPLWLELFPDAKVIHIYRHGVDVAQSLHVRAEAEQAAGQQFHAQRRVLYWAWPKRGDLNRFLSCMPLERSFALWEAYLARAQEHVQALGEQACELKYEDLLVNPVPSLQSLASFCGLSASDDEIVRVAGRAHLERAYAYQASPLLRDFAQHVAPRLHTRGYAAPSESPDLPAVYTRRNSILLPNQNGTNGLHPMRRHHSTNGSISGWTAPTSSDSLS